MSDDTADHTSPQPTGAAVPIAQPIPIPDPDGPVPHLPLPFPVQPLPQPQLPIPLPPLHRCNINLPEGCYRIAFMPNSQLGSYQGTMRVDKSGGKLTVSGDLYWSPPFLHPIGIPPMPFLPFPFPVPLGIPVYARNRYHSYLKVTNVSIPVFSWGPCTLTLTVEQYEYTQPPAGSYDGSFPATPTRTLTIALSPQAPPAGFTSSYFSGTVSEGATPKGSFTMGWVSSFFRKATLEIDTLTGAVAAQAVPALSGSGTEDFRSVFATAGWDLSVIYDQTAVPVPAGVTSTACWSAANLHALMLSVRKPSTNLDQEWRMHLVVVPATMGCGRGVMYDTINVPREGVASFSDDGYPTGQSANFGTAANKKQRDVPRAFLRSGCHEVGHGFNQIHQENESGADNSIMTTTPSVADVLGGPATGAPGVFPANIALQFNDHVRHHLVHFPDPVVRPGGMTFGTGHSATTIPQVDKDRYFFEPEDLSLTLQLQKQRIKLGEPLPLTWELTNASKAHIPAPNDVRVEAQHAFVSVIDPQEHVKQMRSFVIQTDTVKIHELKPGEKLAAKSDLFWSTQGFAFTTPGSHTVELRILWSYGGAALGVKTSAEVWVDYPVSDADNEVASHLMHDEVGKFVALGGGATHLKEAVSRIEGAVSKYADHPACQRMADFEGHKHSKRHK